MKIVKYYMDTSFSKGSKEFALSPTAFKLRHKSLLFLLCHAYHIYFVFIPPVMYLYLI